MDQRVGKRLVRICALGVVAATGLGASAPLAGAAQAPRRQPSCSWPVSSGQISAALGVSVQSATVPMQFTEPVFGGKAHWMMCVYYGGAGATGDVIVEYTGGVGTQRVFTALERGFTLAKHIQHVTAISGMGSEAFYAVSSDQTYLFAHVGTTMFMVFAKRPPAKVIGLGRTIARAL
ncbi:MAG: hypothetical protein M0Z33_08660 [Actinomycetota bacterium]|nr:hypothetical protein [Actinomycetota bacterium]